MYQFIHPLVNTKITIDTKIIIKHGAGMKDEQHKTIRLSKAMWKAISDYRFDHRFPSEIAAIKAIIAKGLKVK